MGNSPEDQVVHDFGELPSSLLRVRLLRPKSGRPGSPLRLDVREYIDKSAEEGGYVGWTRRGVRLDAEDTIALAKMIPQAQELGL